MIFLFLIFACAAGIYGREHGLSVAQVFIIMLLTGLANFFGYKATGQL